MTSFVNVFQDYLSNYRYVRALGAYYLRLTGTALDCYKYLEPLLNDFRKIRIQNRDGKFELSHMDEFIDLLLREERACDVILPRIQVIYTSICSDRCQFHQHFMSTFARKKFKLKTQVQKKLCAKLFYENAARKMFVKSSPGVWIAHDFHFRLALILHNYSTETARARGER